MSNPATNTSQVPLSTDYQGDGIDYSGQFMTNQQFDSIEDAIVWAKGVAIGIGFELIVSSHKYNGKLLRCNKGERYRGGDRDIATADRKHTKTKYCKCPFQIKVEKMYGSDIWVIIPRPGEKGTHNHGLAVYPEGHRQMSGLSRGAKQLVEDMSKTAAKPCSILAAVQEKFPDDNPTRRHIYNYKDKMRKDAFEKRDVIGQFYHLASTHNYLHWTQVNPGSAAVTHLFMAHPTAVNLLRTYKWYIGMDTTFKTNKYKMPLLEIVGMTPCNKNFLIAYALMSDETAASYTWALERLRILIGCDDCPCVIVTDRELGLMTPIAEVFPKAAHLLCTWHINRDVEDKVYRMLGKNRSLAEVFRAGKWRKILEAATDAEFTAACTRMRLAWAMRLDILEYIDKTWLEYKEMFVHRWMNGVLHFGNVTNCRVESAHAELKQWLSSSTGALDTLWTKIDKEIHAQLTTIRGQLEDSRNRTHLTFTGFPFNYLSGRVSHYCLELLGRELKRMRDLSVQVFDRCGCVLPRTHGLPCACELRIAVDSRTPISIDRIHEFWRTLVIRVDSKSIVPDSDDGVAAPSEDHRYFHTLVDEVDRADPAVARSISLLMTEQLHPEAMRHEEPQVKTTGKGRPKGSSSTRRLPSSWEYSQRGRGRPPSSGSSRGRGYTSSSSVNQDSRSGQYIHDYPYAHLIAADILPYVETVVDVLGDGNCGFRVLADYVFGGQDHWRTARQCLANEIAVKRNLYGPIYYDGIDEAYYRIMWDGGSCGPDHWMDVVEDLFPIATFFNAAVMYFGYGQGRRNSFNCMTVLPLQAASASTRPEREIVFGHLGDNYRHYIRLNLRSDFPVPPIVDMWYNHHQRSVEGWDQYYAARRAQWDRNVAH